MAETTVKRMGRPPKPPEEIIGTRNAVSFRADPSLLENIEARATRETRGLGVGVLSARDLARYYDILARELRRVSFTEPEARALVDVVKRGEFDEVYFFWSRIADDTPDGEALAEKVRKMSIGGKHAIVDACERLLIGDGETVFSVGLCK